jgi:hypothetical protein
VDAVAPASVVVSSTTPASGDHIAVVDVVSAAGADAATTYVYEWWAGGSQVGSGPSLEAAMLPGTAVELRVYAEVNGVRSADYHQSRIAVAGWSVPFNDGALVIGAGPGAADGLDPVDAPADSGAPVWFRSPVPGGAPLSADIRSDVLPTLVWTVVLSGGAAGARLDWDGAEFPADLYFGFAEQAGLDAPLDLAQMQSLASVPGAGISAAPGETRVVTLVCGKVFEETISLKPGWNVASTSLIALDRSVAGMFANWDVKPTVWEWTGVQYLIPDAVMPYRGYWVMPLPVQPGESIPEWRVIGIHTPAGLAGE